MNVGHLLLDTVSYQVETGLSSAGAVTWGTLTSTPARVEWGTQTVVTSDGTRRESEASIVTEVEIPNHARVWLPGDSTSNVNLAKRPILAKKAALLTGGYTLFETYF